MKRREFIALVGGVAAAWPFSASAQQSDRVRRIGVLMSLAVTDPESQERKIAFEQGLKELGWIDGRNVRIEYRWVAGDAGNARKFAAELVALEPDVILVSGGAIVAPLLQLTHTVPVVFTQTPDPVGAGFVDSVARPGGNATGFTNSEYAENGKLLELLKQIAPGVTRAAVLRDPASPQGTGQWGAIQAAAPAVRVEVSAVNVRDTGEIERAVAAFARSPNGGLVVPGSALVIVHRKLIIALAARYKLPAVYPARYFATDGGLISYGADANEPHRRAAAYIDRILKGEKPGDLPVQAPTKYQLVINLKTAKALDLAVSPSLLARADEVIDSSS
jgi:putative ABC transport system substrate-binding protein